MTEKPRERPASAPDNEAAFLWEEMPPPMPWLLEDAQPSRADRVRCLIDGFVDLCMLTYSVGLGMLVASQRDAEARRGACAWLAGEIARNKVASKRKKADGDWFHLATQQLPNWIVELSEHHDLQVDPRDSILGSILANGRTEPTTIRLRNLVIHGRAATQAPSTDEFAADCNTLLQDLVEVFGYWSRYGVGHVLDDSGRLRFHKARCADLGPTPGRALRATIPACSQCAHGDTKPVVLIGEQEKRVWPLSPFVIFRALPWKGREGAYYYLDVCEDRPSWFARFVGNRETNVHEGAPEAAPGGVLRGAHECIGAPLDLAPGQFDEVFDPKGGRLNILLHREGDEAVFAPAPSPGRDSPILNWSGGCGVIQVARKGDITQHVFAAKVLRTPGIAGQRAGGREGTAEVAARMFERERRFLATRSAGKSSGAPAHLVTYQGGGMVSCFSAGGGELAGRPFFLMDYVDRSVRDTINSRDRDAGPDVGPASPDAYALRVVKKVARALYMAERAASVLAELYTSVRKKKTVNHVEMEVHFLHRDVKPENLLDAGFGIIRLCDFSSAFLPTEDDDAMFDASEECPDTDYALNALLTRQYCAPEVWLRPRLYSPTADVFSLGLVLDELLFGSQKNTQAVARASRYGVKGEWTRPSDLNRVPFYTAPSPPEQEVLDHVGAFAKSAGHPEWDLRSIVQRATAPSSLRWTMPELQAAVEQAGTTLRLYTAERCRERVSTALANPSDHLGIQHAFGSIAGAFGELRALCPARPTPRRERHKRRRARS